MRLRLRQRAEMRPRMAARPRPRHPPTHPPTAANGRARTGRGPGGRERGSAPGGVRGRPPAVRAALSLRRRRRRSRRHARSCAARDRLCRPFQRGQVEPRQRGHGQARAGAHLQHAGAHAGAQLLRPRRPPCARRPAGLRLRRRLQDQDQGLDSSGGGLSARPADASACLPAARRAARHHGGRRACRGRLRSERGVLPRGADQVRQARSGGAGSADCRHRGGARHPRRRLSDADRHQRAHRRRHPRHSGAISLRWPRPRE